MSFCNEDCLLASNHLLATTGRYLVHFSDSSIKVNVLGRFFTLNERKRESDINHRSVPRRIYFSAKLDNIWRHLKLYCVFLQMQWFLPPLFKNCNNLCLFIWCIRRSLLYFLNVTALMESMYVHKNSSNTV